jgi:hypothetical protein
MYFILDFTIIIRGFALKGPWNIICETKTERKSVLTTFKKIITLVEFPYIKIHIKEFYVYKTHFFLIQPKYYHHQLKDYYGINLFQYLDYT